MLYGKENNVAVKPIITYPDPLLERISEPVGDNLEGIAELVRDMTDTMYAATGADLAAVQIGVHKRLFIIEAMAAGGEAKDPPMVFIDPEVIELSPEKEVAEEGCLSFPGIYLPVKRSLRAKTRARNLRGETFEVEGEGLFARAMQHEAEHLDGLLFIRFVGRLKRQMVKRRLAREAAENG